MVRKVLAVQEQAEQEQQQGQDQGGEPEGGGASESESEGEGEEEPEGGEKEKTDPAASAAAAAPVGKPSRLQLALAAVQSKGELLKRATAAEALAAGMTNDLAAERATVASQAATITTLRAEIQGLQTELAEIGSVLETAKAEAKSVEEKAVEIVAAVGVEAGKLPAATAEDQDDSEGLRAKLSATKDPKEKYALAQQLKALRWAN